MSPTERPSYPTVTDMQRSIPCRLPGCWFPFWVPVSQASSFCGFSCDVPAPPHFPQALLPLLSRTPNVWWGVSQSAFWILGRWWDFCLQHRLAFCSENIGQLVGISDIWQSKIQPPALRTWTFLTEPFMLGFESDVSHQEEGLHCGPGCFLSRLCLNSYTH